jgi:hypothetical protein
MSKNEWKKLVGVAGRLLLAFAFVFSQTAWAGQNQQNKDKMDSQQKATAQQPGEKQSATATTARSQSNQAQGEESEGSVAEEKPGEPSHQSIKVHGHWTIEVRNTDGTLATHREFENSLSGGASVLSNVLGRASTVGSYEIRLLGAVTGTVATLFIDEAGTPEASFAGTTCASNPNITACSTSLTVTVGNGTLTLAGNVVIPPSFGPNVNDVSTFVNTCNPTSTPQACPSTSTPPGFGFTSRSLDGLNGDPAAVPVSPGQTAAVTVTFNFS